MKDQDKDILDPVGSMLNVGKEKKSPNLKQKSCPVFSTTCLGKKGGGAKLDESNLVD